MSQKAEFNKAVYLLLLSCFVWMCRHSISKKYPQQIRNVTIPY